MEASISIPTRNSLSAVSIARLTLCAWRTPAPHTRTSHARRTSDSPLRIRSQACTEAAASVLAARPARPARERFASVGAPCSFLPGELAAARLSSPAGARGDLAPPCGRWSAVDTAPRRVPSARVLGGRWEAARPRPGLLASRTRGTRHARRRTHFHRRSTPRAALAGHPAPSELAGLPISTPPTWPRFLGSMPCSKPSPPARPGLSAKQLAGNQSPMPHFDSPRCLRRRRTAPRPAATTAPVRHLRVHLEAAAQSRARGCPRPRPRPRSVGPFFAAKGENSSRARQHLCLRSPSRRRGSCAAAATRAAPRTEARTETVPAAARRRGRARARPGDRRAEPKHGRPVRRRS